MKSDEDSIWYKYVCPCGCDNAGHTVFLNIDKYGGFVHAEVYYTLDACQYWGSWWESLKRAVKILFKRPVHIEGYFMFDEQGLQDYIEALQEGLDQLKNK